MKHYKKAFISSIITFILGTSCCWLSSLAIWLGGAALLGIFIDLIESIQIQLLFVSLFLGIITVYLYISNLRKKSKQ